MPEKITISIFGAGRVGQTLGRLWRENGYTIETVICQRKQSARRAARFIGAGSPEVSTVSAMPKSRVFLLSVPDDELQTAVLKLQRLFTDLHGSVVLHTSGSLSSEILNP